MPHTVIMVTIFANDQTHICIILFQTRDSSLQFFRIHNIPYNVNRNIIVTSARYTIVTSGIANWIRIFSKTCFAAFFIILQSSLHAISHLTNSIEVHYVPFSKSLVFPSIVKFVDILSSPSKVIAHRCYTRITFIFKF